MIKTDELQAKLESLDDGDIISDLSSEARMLLLFPDYSDGSDDACLELVLTGLAVPTQIEETSRASELRERYGDKG